jgi:hypothetical protein
MTAPRAERRIALAFAVGLTAAACVIAALVHVACAPRARELLGFPFAGLTPSPSTALAIFTHNTGVLAMVFAAIVVVRAPWMAARDGARGLLATMILSATDTLLALQVALNTALVGVALGAYGTRMFSALFRTARSRWPPTRWRSRSTCTRDAARSPWRASSRPEQSA